MRRLATIPILLLLATTASAATSTQYLLAKAWPRDAGAKVAEIGRGVGVVFSPDLSVPGNCRFYQALGFACFEDTHWDRVLDGIRSYNILYPEHPIRTLVLETHGTNGNGLKLQGSYDPKAERSYISVGALQERLEPDGIETIIISACNSGRLLRPAIYKALDPNCGDKLFLPATCGIINASDDFDPELSRIVVATPKTSHIETTLAGAVRELSPSARRAITASARELGITPPTDFAISELMMQMLVRDPHLELVTGAYVDELSRTLTPESQGERLFRSFTHLINGLAAKQYPVVAAKKPAAKRKGVPAKAVPAAKTARVR
jgi:hypothetical protein